MNGKSQDGHTSIVQFLPNAITLFALCAGLTSIRLMTEGRIEHAVYLILLAAFLDAIDGKVARYLGCSSALGAQLDSFADFFNFGVAPGLLVFQMAYQGQSGGYSGWIAVLILAMCCALRLARFNVDTPTDDPDAPPAQYFVGVPAPALAFLVLLPVYIYLSGYEAITDHAHIITIYTILVAGLAISRIPTFSAKSIRITRRWHGEVIFLVVLILTLLSVYPWETLTLLSFVYLATLPFSWRKFRSETDLDEDSDT